MKWMILSYIFLEITIKYKNYKITKSRKQKAQKSQITEELLKNHSKISLKIIKITKNYKSHVLRYFEVICPALQFALAMAGIIVDFVYECRRLKLSGKRKIWAEEREHLIDYFEQTQLQ